MIPMVSSSESSETWYTCSLEQYACLYVTRFNNYSVMPLFRQLSVGVHSAALVKHSPICYLKMHIQQTTFEDIVA